VNIRAVGPALAVTGVALAAGAVAPLVPRPARLPITVAATAAAVALSCAAGATAEDLGCDPADLGSGARAGTVAAGFVGTAVAAAVATPATRGLFADARVTDASSGRAAYEVLVRIPFGTSLVEEVLFRGAVLGAWKRALGTPAAVAVSSLAFGVWHVLPALESHTHNHASAGLSARAGGRSTHVGATVLATAVAGAAFATLRLRSRSVLAPVLAHAMVNQAGYLGARWAHAPRQPAAVSPVPPAAAKSSSAMRRTTAWIRASGSSPRSRASR
jgi:membrane protease YdiL (CAAX protease family)